MNKKTKIFLGITDIIFVFISTTIGLWLLNNAAYDSTIRFIFSFFLSSATMITILTVINSFKKD